MSVHVPVLECLSFCPCSSNIPGSVIPQVTKALAIASEKSLTLAGAQDPTLQVFSIPDFQ